MYDPIKFWTAYGNTEPTPKLKDPENREYQEKQLVEIFKKCGDFKSFLDVGCGFGRVSHLVLENFPQVEVVHGFDVSRRRVQWSYDNCKHFEGNGIGTEVNFYQSEFLKFEPKRKYDLVFSCEVLMHALPEELSQHIYKTIEWSNRHIINVDWFETKTPDYPIADFNFMHAYPDIYDRLVLDGTIKQMRSYNLGRKQFLFHSVK